MDICSTKVCRVYVPQQIRLFRVYSRPQRLPQIFFQAVAL